ncbi:UNVERIFIED_ORG: propionyl-CoA synthetase [Idiomarina abyssalis]|uniref:acetate--CoA ligase n=1 Tax=Idiomarina sp. 017G TaxID=2183988 RepID=UPI000E0E5C50|nr:acetate--CoA ligase [Idiomarina sp. 017G]TDO53101.1 propionyl-CoA synthetase [Idiomarina sp. 017G]
MQAYKNVYSEAQQDPEGFWLEQARRLNWFKTPKVAAQVKKNGLADWFPDGEVNISYLALDAQIEAGRGEQVALYYDSPVTQSKANYTFNQLREQVACFAHVLKQQGVEKGDRVIIYLPMIPQAAIAMLACARIGAIHSVVFGGFAAHELAVRIDDAAPKLIITASCGIEGTKVLPYKPIVDKALAEASYKPRTIVYQREQCQADMQEGQDTDWEQALTTASPVEAVPLPATHPLYILYTSGTTGKPKGVVRDHGGYAVALNFSMNYVYGLKPGEVFFTASDVGWVVGHSYIVYGPLLFGCSSVLYEGKPVNTPDAGAFWRIVQDYNVSAIFSAPTAFRAIKKEDPEGEFIQRYNLSSLKRIYMAGERLDPATYEWTTELTDLPVYDHWWQTESGWPMCANPVGIGAVKVRPGSSTFPVPGYEISVLDPLGKSSGSKEEGAICVRLPLPPGCLTTVWGDEQRLHSSYLNAFPGYYCSGDGGYIDEQGYVFIMGRTDDVINVAGHRLSTGEMEEILAAHKDVAECAVVAQPDELKGELPVGFVILKNSSTIDHEQLQQELIQSIREEIGAIACLKTLHIVPRLPKTRSGKILRRLIRQVLQREDVAVPSTIDDPTSIDAIKETLR